MNSTKFRLCRETDLKEVQVFVDQLYAEDPLTASVRADASLSYHEFLRKPDKGAVIVFESASELIGYCIIIHFWSNEYGGNIIDIDEICISENERGKGVAAELLLWLEKEFPENLKGFSLQISSENKPAQSYARKQGFELSRNQHFIKITK